MKTIEQLIQTRENTSGSKLWHTLKINLNTLYSHFIRRSPLVEAAFCISLARGGGAAIPSSQSDRQPATPGETEPETKPKPQRSMNADSSPPALRTVDQKALQVSHTDLSPYADCVSPLSSFLLVCCFKMTTVESKPLWNLHDGFIAGQF